MQSPSTNSNWPPYRSPGWSTTTLVVLSVALTSFALWLSNEFFVVREQALLSQISQQYAARLSTFLSENEERLKRALVHSGPDAQREDHRRLTHRLFAQDSSILRIELRGEDGSLNAEFDRPLAATVWPVLSRVSAPPAVHLAVGRAINQNKSYSAKSFAPNGDKLIELVIPDARLQKAWIVITTQSSWRNLDRMLNVPSDIEVRFQSFDAARALPFNWSPVVFPGLNEVVVTEFTDSHRVLGFVQFSSLIIVIMGVSLSLLIYKNHIAGKQHLKAMQTIELQAQALEKTAQLNAFAEFSTTIAHELNQPLTTLVNYIAAGEVLLTKEEEVSSEQIVSVLKKARYEAMRAGEIIHSLRGLMNRKRDNSQIINVTATIDKIRPVLELISGHCNIQIVFSSQPVIPLVKADPLLMELVLLNLTKNAIDAMDKTPMAFRKIDIHTSTQRNEAGAEVIISVTDRGHGIDEAHNKNLLASFYSTKADGMGIGLSFCRSFAESVAGRLSWRNNKEGLGANFSISIPAAEPSSTAPP